MREILVLLIYVLAMSMDQEIIDIIKRQIIALKDKNVAIYGVPEKGTKSFSILSRVAQVKAQRQVSTFFNGSTVTAEFIIKTTEEKADSSEVKTTVETIEKIKENSVGFVNGLELLTNFDIDEGERMLFIYIKKIEDE